MRHAPGTAPGAAAGRGHQGHDEYAAGENVLTRRLPIPGAGTAGAAGRMPQLHYKPVPGETSWQPKLDRMVEL